MSGRQSKGTRTITVKKPQKTNDSKGKESNKKNGSYYCDQCGKYLNVTQQQFREHKDGICKKAKMEKEKANKKEEEDKQKKAENKTKSSASTST